MSRLALTAVTLLAVCAPAAAAAAPPRATPAKAVRVTEGAASVRVPITLTRPAGRRAGVRFRTVRGTAGAADFVARSGTLRWRRGSRRASIAVRLARDAADEPDERFTVRLSKPRGVRLGARRSTTVTILDDDASAPPGAGGVPFVSPADRTVAEPGPGGAIAAHGLALTLSAPARQGVTVHYALVAGGATTTADDVDLGAGSLTFAPGDTAKVIPGSVRGDALDESDEHVRVLLTSAAGAQIADPEALLAITDDPADVPPVVSVADAVVTEAAGSTAQIQVSLGAASGRTVTVGYATQDDTATSTGPAPDYAPTAGTLAFQPGETAKVIAVAIQDDPRDEPAQALALALSAPDGATPGDARASVTIDDDDPPPTLSIDDVSKIESDSAARFTASLSQISEHSVAFRVTTIDQTAVGGSACGGGTDYVRLDNLNVTINPGAPGAAIDVAVCQDTSDEVTETASALLSNLSNATIADGTGLLTILDND